ncbi:helix-turn-helix domain-containing protein [Kerstersia sp.]|uniref:helix-turn-helix domain-containing protein n=1 Tax=Kerstersia sp. TaxID=1930783 RepID=UPI003F8F4AFA
MAATEIRTSSVQQWSDIASKNFLELDIESSRSTRFFTSALIAQFGDSIAAELYLTATRVLRPRLIAENGPLPCFKLYWQLDGESRICQGNQDTRLRKGMWSVYDTTREYSIESSEYSRSLVLLVPQHESRGWSPAVAALAGRAMAGGGTAHIVLSSLSALLREPGPLDPGSQQALQDATVNLLQQALASQARQYLDTRIQEPDARLQRAIRLINERLSEPGLTADVVARELGMARRTLYNLFTLSGTTPRAFIQQARLDWACQMLAQPAWRDTPVAEIARHTGFADPAHFSKVFTARHGVSPAIWRIGQHSGKTPERPRPRPAAREH